MTAVAGEEAGRKTANRALNTARKTLKVVPVDAAPEVVALNTELALEKPARRRRKAFWKAIGARREQSAIGVKVTVKAIGSSTSFPAPKLGKVLTATGPAHRIGPCPHSAASA